MKNIQCLLPLVLAASLAAQAQSITYVDNITSATSTSPELLGTGRFYAQAFTTDNSAPYFTLNAVALGSTTGDVGQVYIATGLAWSDQLFPLYTRYLGREGDTAVYSPLDLRVEPATTYWLITQWGGGYQENWLFGESTNTAGWEVAGWTTANATFGQYSESSWAPIRYDAPYLFSISATPASAVPKPSTIALVLGFVSLAGSWLCRRGKRSAERAGS